MNKITFFLLLSVFFCDFCNFCQVNYGLIDKIVLTDLENVEYHIIYEDNNDCYDKKCCKTK